MAELSSDFIAELNEKVINPAFEVARQNYQGLINVISDGDLRQPEAGHKLSWLDMQVDARGSVLNGNIDTATTTVTVGNGGSFRAGQMVSVKGSTEVMLVTAVSGNDLTVIRAVQGVATAGTSGDSIYIDSVGREENSIGTDDGIVEPTKSENYFQTMDGQLTFSRRALALAQQGNYNDIQFQLDELVRQKTIETNRMLIRGVKYSTTAINSKLITYSGGLNYWASQTGAISNAIGGALTLTNLDDAVEDIVLAGGMTDTILVNTKQARKLQSLINANYTSQRLDEVNADRGGLIRLSSDLPILGSVNQIVVDTNVQDDELFLVDSSKLRLIPMASGNAQDTGAWRTLDATQKGQDGYSVRIVGDYGIEMRNWKTNFAKLTGLS